MTQRHTLFKCIPIVAASIVLLAFAGDAGAQSASVTQGRVLVKFKPGSSRAAIQAAAAELNATVLEDLPKSGIQVLRLAGTSGQEGAANALRRRSDVLFAEVDRKLPLALTPNDPLFANQWHLPRISAPAAWQRTQGSASIVIAILDTGVDSTHPDLAARMVPGWNMHGNNSDSRDVQGHGTMVAGCASASSNNALGIVGLTWNTRIMPIRVSEPDGMAYFSRIAEGLVWARQNGARVANISYGATPSSSIQWAAQQFTEAGGVVVSSAGNDGQVNPTPDTPWIVTVSATNSADALTSWSTRGAFIDVSAPGLDIFTTTRGGGYGPASGTSFSSPIVAGVAALVLSAKPTLTGPQAIQTLRASTDDLGAPGWDPLYGTGRINADRAVAMVGSTGGSDTTLPGASFTSPVNGARVSGTTTVRVAATDDVGIASVEFLVDMVPQGTRTSAPYDFTWNTRQVANGSRVLTAIARDAAGNSITTQVSAVVANDRAAPTVAFVSPSAGSRLGGVATVRVAATDDVGVSSVEFRVDGLLVGVRTAAPYAFSWNTRGWPSGARTLTAIARDAAGNAGAAQIPVTVFNDMTPPTVAFTSPSSGATVRGTLNVQIVASDNVGVSSVEFRVNGVRVGLKTAGPYTFSWNTATVPTGVHFLSAVVRDAAGNGAMMTIVVFVNNAAVGKEALERGGGLTAGVGSGPGVERAMAWSPNDGASAGPLPLWSPWTLRPAPHALHRSDWDAGEGGSPSP